MKKQSFYSTGINEIKIVPFSWNYTKMLYIVSHLERKAEKYSESVNIYIGWKDSVLSFLFSSAVDNSSLSPSPKEREFLQVCLYGCFSLSLSFFNLLICICYDFSGQSGISSLALFAFSSLLTCFHFVHCSHRDS